MKDKLFEFLNIINLKVLNSNIKKNLTQRKLLRYYKRKKRKKRKKNNLDKNYLLKIDFYILLKNIFK